MTEPLADSLYLTIKLIITVENHYLIAKLKPIVKNYYLIVALIITVERQYLITKPKPIVKNFYLIIALIITIETHYQITKLEPKLIVESYYLIATLITTVTSYYLIAKLKPIVEYYYFRLRLTIEVLYQIIMLEPIVMTPYLMMKTIITTTTENYRFFRPVLRIFNYFIWVNNVQVLRKFVITEVIAGLIIRQKMITPAFSSDYLRRHIHLMIVVIIRLDLVTFSYCKSLQFKSVQD